MSKPGPKPGRSPYALQEADYAVTYQQEYTRCGRASCHCATGPGHGPYWYAYHYSPTLKRRINTYCGKQRPAAAPAAPDAPVKQVEPGQQPSPA